MLGIRPDADYLSQSNRAIFPYSKNETPSYVPNRFLGSGLDKLEDRFLKQPVESILEHPQRTDDPLQLVQSIEQDIKNHIEMGVILSKWVNF